MIEKILSVKDEVGLHARPASLFVKLAQEFDGTVLVKFNKINNYCLGYSLKMHWCLQLP